MYEVSSAGTSNALVNQLNRGGYIAFHATKLDGPICKFSYSLECSTCVFSV